MIGEMEQQWRDWAQRRQLGSDEQIDAAVGAALEAVARGATSDEAASAAYAAATATSAPAAAPSSSANRASSAAGRAPDLAPGGITWEDAMARAAYALSRLPSEGKVKLSRENTLAEFNLALAQGWIGFARELTMRSRMRSGA
jgi:hypothetical protein